jgi:hypothetical protein
MLLTQILDCLRQGLKKMHIIQKVFTVVFEIIIKKIKKIKILLWIHTIRVKKAKPSFKLINLIFFSLMLKHKFSETI